MSCLCRLCGRGAQEIGGYLARVNEKGIPGIWECRPSCDASLPFETNLMLAIEGETSDAKGAEIANLTYREGKRTEMVIDLQEQLRASNEQLVAAQARIAELAEFVGMCADEVSKFEANREINGNWARRAVELMGSDNLTAIAENNKEVAAKALEDAADAMLFEGDAEFLRRMATELRAKGKS